jgi:hypothetical protein
MRRPIPSSLTPLLWGVLFAGCSGISFNSDFDPSADFSAYKTYAWMEVADPSRSQNRGVSELVEKRIAAAVDENLVAKGYTKRMEPPVDFVVNFMLTTQEKIDFNTYYTGWGYYGWYGGTQVEARQYTEGTLIVDIFDAETKELAWRGMAQGTIDPSLSPEQRTARINQAVGGILQRFPPGSK